MGGPTRPTPGVPFVSRRKEPKACRGCAPGPPRGTLRSPCGARNPLEGVSTIKQDRFATLSWWANRSFFSLSFTRRHFLLSIRGTAGFLPRGCRRFYTPATKTARAEAGGIQGGSPPCAGGPGTRRSLAYLCLLSLREKVGRGLGRSAQKVGAGTTSPAKPPTFPTLFPKALRQTLRRGSPPRWSPSTPATAAAAGHRSSHTRSPPARRD